jgi:hypothetical protein
LGERWRWTYLGVTRVGIKHVRKELGCHSYTRYDEAVDVEIINDKIATGRFPGEFGHAIEVDEEGNKNLVGGWTIFEDTEKIRFEGDRWYIASMK